MRQAHCDIFMSLGLGVINYHSVFPPRFSYTMEPCCKVMLIFFLQTELPSRGLDFETKLNCHIHTS